MKKYVKLIAKSDSWFLEGTEVWDYDETRRMTVEEWKSWDGFVCLVSGIRKCQPDEYSYEKEYIDKFGKEFRVDGENCSCSEFEVQLVDDIGTKEISELIKFYK